jgi:hypothetical protein
MKKHLGLVMLLSIMFMVNCARLDRGCSSCLATNLGANWVVVELTEAGAKPYRCWELQGVTITSEEGSDGIFWKDSTTNNLIHVAGSYDYVQVKGTWDSAFRQLGLTREKCKAIRESQYDLRLERYVRPGEMTSKPPEVNVH